MCVTIVLTALGFLLGLLYPCSAGELKLSVALSTERSEYYVGDLVEVSFTIRNEGETSYTFFDRDYDRSGRMPEYELEVRDTKGNPCCVPESYYMGMGGGLGSHGKLEPGESSTKKILLQLWACPRIPGTYLITGHYEIEQHLVGTDKAVPRTAVSAPIRLTLKPMPPEVLKRNLNDLQVIAENDIGSAQGQAVLGLGVLGVPAVIPSLVRYLDGEQRFWACKALLYVPDREAVRRAFDDYMKTKKQSGNDRWFLSMLKIPFDSNRLDSGTGKSHNQDKNRPN